MDKKSEIMKDIIKEVKNAPAGTTRWNTVRGPPEFKTLKVTI